MRYVILFFAFFLNIVGIDAQVSKAILAHKNGEIALAKSIADSLSEIAINDQDAEIWYVKGMVYESIYLSSQSEINRLADEPLRECAVAYLKACMAPKNKRFNTLSNRRLDSMVVPAVIKEATTFERMGKYRNALNSIDIYLLIKPKDTLGFARQAMYAEKAGDYQTAKSSYQKMLGLGSKSLHIYKSLILLHADIDQNYPHANKLLKEAKVLYPFDPDLVKMEVNLHVEMKNYQLAIRLADSLAKTTSTDKIRYNFLIGAIYDKIDSVSLAKEYYTKVLESDPLHFEANYNMGGIYYKKASVLYEKVNAMEYGVYQRVGKKSQEQADDYSKSALPYFEKAYESKKDEDLKSILSALYKNLKMKDKTLRN